MAYVMQHAGGVGPFAEGDRVAFWATRAGAPVVQTGTVVASRLVRWVRVRVDGAYPAGIVVEVPTADLYRLIVKAA